MKSSRKKISDFFKSKIGKITISSFVFIFLFILVLNNVGLAFREKIQVGSTLDFSWFSDSIERMLHGYIQGRDFTFTYGPLFQLIYSLPSLILHVPSYISVAISPLVSFVLIFLLVLFISKSITKLFFEQISYILFLFLILGLLISSTDMVRILIPMGFSLILLETFKKKLHGLRYCVVAIIPTLVGLYSYNLFIITLILTGVFVVINLYKNATNWSRNSYLLLLVPAIIVFHLFFSLLFTHNLNYILNSLDSIYNYRYLMNLTWTPDRSNIILIFPIVLIFLGHYLIKAKTISTEIKSVLLIFILTSFVEFFSILSRSDAGHLQLGVYPSIITFFTIIFIISKKNKSLITVAFIFYLLVPFKPIFYNTFAPKNIFKVFSIIREKPSFFNIYKLPENYYYSENEIKNIAKIVKNNKDKVYVYPYDSYILNIENSTFNSFSLGIYGYSNSLVEENMVKGFMKNPPALIILGVDTRGTLNLDDIPNFTRNPLIAKWMLKYYIVKEVHPQYLLLLYDPKKTLVSNICQSYDLTINLSKKENFLQKISDFIKSPLYYLGELRLPYSPYVKNYLIFGNTTNSFELASLFNATENSTCKVNPRVKKDELTITRVSPFFGRKEQVVFSKNEFSISQIKF